ncbi:alpha/beta hydrolase [Saccharomonospora piscinae]|uniref:alpha/beta fold hydrolase n=1 Tax=Saccharomonospora piscinae TaxID=687388 RepID=UPI001107472D|nr:alpha/beta hydrolase [Saccharomonospora piscinae]TLW89682.1 alpha/beta hydrolase [Saccharomonospora piscinae]
MSARRFTTADGTSLAVEWGGGSGDSGDFGDFTADGPTVVLVHGWTQDRGTWDRVVELLPPDVRWMRYDLRGHGESAPAVPGGATIARLADDLAEIVEDAVTTGRVAPHGGLLLAGHSMGGMTIMALAERHPELVRQHASGVVFVSTACADMGRVTLGLPGAAGRAAHRVERGLATALAGYRRDRLPLRPAVARVGTRWLVFGRRPRRADVASVTDQLLRAHPASVGAFQTEISVHDRTAALATLRGVPGAVLTGTADRLCSPRHARAIADELGSAHLVTLPDAGHMLAHERAHDVADQITAVAARREAAPLPS